MELDVALRQSEFAITTSAEAFKAAILLWCAAWHEQPASSLPNNDKLLSYFAGYGNDIENWLKVKEEALQGFILCSDGRLYHPSLAEKAAKAWDYKKSQRNRVAAATEKRKAMRAEDRGNRHEDRHVSPNVDRDDARNRIQRKGTERTGIEMNEYEQERGWKNSPLLAEGMLPDGFEQFWERYPNKVGEKAARGAFEKILSARLATLGEIISGLETYKRSKPGDRRWLNPVNFLNEERWKDRPAPLSKPQPVRSVAI